MGLFSTIKSSLNEVHEEARSSTLLADLEPTMQAVELLPQDLKEVALRGFLEQRQNILSSLPNWSREGALVVAKKLFEEAREHQHLNRAHSLGCALTALWLESGMRETQKALAVHVKLETVARAMAGEEPLKLPPQLQPPPSCPNPNAIDADTFPDRPWQFGYSEQSPIPINWREGAESYLARLRHGNQVCQISRLSDLSANNFTGFPIERYRLSLDYSMSSPRWTLYLSPYQLRTSLLAPSAFLLITN